MRISRLIPLAAVGLVAFAAPARAQTWTNYCYPGQLWTCFSASVTTVANGGGTDVTLMVRNSSSAVVPGGDGSWITALGFSAPSNIGTASGLALSTSGSVNVVGTPSSLWSFTSSSMGFGSFSYLTTTSSPDPKTGAIVGCGTTPNSSAYYGTCAPSYTGFVVFNFHTTGSWVGQNAALLVKWQTSNGSFECSTDNSFAGGGTASDGTVQNQCTTTVTPEPLTLTLLGTGLAGMGGAGLFRRRKKNGEIEG